MDGLDCPAAAQYSQVLSLGPRGGGTGHQRAAAHGHARWHRLQRALGPSNARLLACIASALTQSWSRSRSRSIAKPDGLKLAGCALPSAPARTGLTDSDIPQARSASSCSSSNSWSGGACSSTSSDRGIKGRRGSATSTRRRRGSSDARLDFTRRQSLDKGSTTPRRSSITVLGLVPSSVGQGEGDGGGASSALSMLLHADDGDGAVHSSAGGGLRSADADSTPPKRPHDKSGTHWASWKRDVHVRPVDEVVEPPPLPPQGIVAESAPAHRSAFPGAAAAGFGLELRGLEAVFPPSHADVFNMYTRQRSFSAAVSSPSASSAPIAIPGASRERASPEFHTYA